MTTSNKPENLNTNEAHDLGQIIIETYVYKDTYWARIKRDHHWETSVAHMDGECPSSAHFIHWGFCIKNPNESQFSLCLYLAEAVSKSKAERDYAKKTAQDLEQTGRAFYKAATEAIANAKAHKGEQQ